MAAYRGSPAPNAGSARELSSQQYRDDRQFPQREEITVLSSTAPLHLPVLAAANSWASSALYLKKVR